MDKIKFNILIALLKTDVNALTEIYEFYYKRIVLYVQYNYSKFDMDFAEEVAQEFFAYLLENAGKFGTFDKPTAWVLKVVTSIANRKVKKISSDTSLEICCDLVDNHTVFDLQKNVINEAISQLEEEEQIIIRNNMWFGYSLREIADELGMNYATIRQKYSRIIKKLKILLRDVKN